MLTTGLTDATWEDTSRRTWSTVTSFAVQVMGLGILLLLPLVYTQGLPQLKLLSQSLITTPTPPPGPPAEMVNSSSTRAVLSNFRNGILMRPDRIPRGIANVDDHGVVPLSATNWVPGGAPQDGIPNGVLNSILSGSHPIMPPKPTPVARSTFRSSTMMQGYLIHRVEPGYPPLARAPRIQGQVRLQAIISKQGAIENLQVLTGHPMLVTAAVAAVRQWRYRPYVLNGEPVEVEIEITVNFVLSGS